MNIAKPELQPPLWKAKLAELFGIDPRALAMFRIGLGVVLLVDLAIRAGDITAFYTDEGIFHSDTIWANYEGKWQWSLHLLSGSFAFQAILFILAAVAAAMLLVGYRTRTATIVSWVLLTSIQMRAPLLNNGGDMLFRMFLFWSMLLPLGCRWSIDARAKTVERITPIYSIASAGLLLQVFIMYFFTGLFKFNEVWLAGDGLYYSLSMQAYGRAPGEFLLGFPQLLRWLSHGTLVLELVGPFLFFFPWKTPYVRTATVLSFVALHVGIEICMTVGLFSFVAIVGLSAFLPAAVWDRFSLGKVEAPVESKAPRKSDTQLVGGWLVTGASLFFLLYIWQWNIATLPRVDFKRVMPSPFHKIGRAAAVGQKWNMFGVPHKSDYWYVAEAELANGSVVDVLRDGAAVPQGKPRLASRTFPNHRWRKFFNGLRSKKYKRFRKPTAKYLERDWNARHGPAEQIVKFKLSYFRHNTGRDEPKDEYLEEVFSQAIGGHQGAFAEDYRKLMLEDDPTEKDKKDRAGDEGEPRDDL